MLICQCVTPKDISEALIHTFVDKGGIYENFQDSVIDSADKHSDDAGEWIDENVITPMENAYDQAEQWTDENIITPMEDLFE